MKNIRLVSILTIFVGSFLVFGVQPMVGNTLLPFFGGTAAVWTVCLAAFQTLLLAGYFYADRMKKMRVHVGLLALGAVWVGVVSWKFRAIAGWAGELPVPALGALAAVVAMVGVPYVLLSSNASLIQSLASKCFGGNDRSVYKLYAVSNAGSFCGLLAYPLLMEPALGIAAQWMCFAAGVAVYAVLAGVMVASVGGEGKRDEGRGMRGRLRSSRFSLWSGWGSRRCRALC